MQIEPFSTNLDELKSLKSLDLSRFHFGPKGAFYLAQNLGSLKSLEILNLSSNPIENEGMRYLSEALKELKNLNELLLDGVSLEDEGAMYLADALSCLPQLQELNLENNDMQDSGVYAVTDRFYLDDQNNIIPKKLFSIYGNLHSDECHKTISQKYEEFLDCQSDCYYDFNPSSCREEHLANPSSH